ncbi:hypothetical protein DIPPA_32956 [Diplonema papillatum]|nr:hypothetical protein DIPPA_32956 [Diplonema papillatum]|eukprot:gene5463-8319_t
MQNTAGSHQQPQTVPQNMQAALPPNTQAPQNMHAPQNTQTPPNMPAPNTQAPNNQGPQNVQAPHQTEQNMRTTAERTAIQSAVDGPAHYVGGAPLPGAAVTKPTPDVIYKNHLMSDLTQAEQTRSHAELEHNTKKDAKFTEKMKDKFNMVQAKAGAAYTEKRNNLYGKISEKAEKENQRKLQTFFAGQHDHVLALFKTKYIDGKSETVRGFLLVTDSNLRFAAEVGSDVRETIPYKQIASVEEVGKPPRINVYTVSQQVYQFTEIQHGQLDMEDVSPSAAAFNWIDHLWRQATAVPNPAATYFSS